MTNLTYLPAIIPTTVVVYLMVVVAVVYAFHRQEKRIEDGTERGTLSLLTAKQPSLLHSYFSVLPFHHTYQSLNPYGGRLLLLATRFISFAYICGISGLWNYIRKDFTNLFYFTHWNVIMISTYYACALSSSIIGFLYNHKLRSGSGVEDNSWIAVETPISTTHFEDTFWSVHVQRLGFVIQILYQVAGASALFITIVAFTFLNPDFDFWNVNAHFVTSMSFLLEMSQNSLIVRWHHVLLNMLWAMAYLVYIWPAVGSGAVTNWPYSFLATETAGCFGWYFSLFLGNVVFYFLWYYFSRAKYERVYAASEAAAGVLPAHYRGTGRVYLGGSAGSEGRGSSGGEGRGGLLGGDSSVHEVVEQQNSPLPLKGGALVGVKSAHSLTGIERGEKV